MYHAIGISSRYVRQRSKSAVECGETVSAGQVLGVTAQAPDPVVTAADVADKLDCSREVVRQKLIDLRERDQVNHRNVGGAGVVWWIVTDAG